MKSPSNYDQRLTPPPGTIPGLLAEDEAPPYRVVNADGSSDLVLVCDHASNKIPGKLQNLGLAPEILASHIAWDPGARSVALALAELLDAPLVVSNYSRLVVDCNRPTSSPESIPSQSAGVPIPGNQNLSEHDRRLRLDSIFHPYQQAIAQLIQDRNVPAALISIHSFTPILFNEYRPWQIGISCFRDARLAELLYTALKNANWARSVETLQVGFNQPYAIEAAFDFTLPTHGEALAIPCAMVEIRQDEFDDDSAALRWADRLALAWRSVQGLIKKKAG